MDYLPFFVWAALVATTLTAALITIEAVRKPHRRLLSVPLATTLTLLLMSVTSVCSFALYRAFLIDEPMAHAACKGETEEVRTFLLRGASPNACVVDCMQSAISCAAEGGHADVVRLLLESGADPYWGRVSAIQAARGKGRDDVVRILSEYDGRHTKPRER